MRLHSVKTGCWQRYLNHLGIALLVPVISSLHHFLCHASVVASEPPANWRCATKWFSLIRKFGYVGDHYQKFPVRDITHTAVPYHKADKKETTRHFRRIPSLHDDTAFSTDTTDTVADIKGAKKVSWPVVTIQETVLTHEADWRIFHSESFIGSPRSSYLYCCYNSRNL